MRLLNRTASVWFAACVSIAICQPAYAQQSQFLVHDASGLCIDVSGAPGINNGAKVQLWECEVQGNRDNGSATDQKWYLQNGFVRNGLSGKCLDVPGAPGVAAGLQAQLWDCELNGRTSNGAQTDQLWDHTNGQIRNRVSGLCLAPKQTDYRNGVPLVLMKCTKPGAGDMEFGFRVPAAQTKPVTTVAKSATPRMIYPDYPGASQTCVIPVDPTTRRFKIDMGSKLMLANCRPEEGQIFLLSSGRLSIAKRPDLCINISAGRSNGELYLETCKDTAVKAWQFTASATASSRLRASGGGGTISVGPSPRCRAMHHFPSK